MARFNTTARWMGWTLHVDCSVAELLAETIRRIAFGESVSSLYVD